MPIASLPPATGGQIHDLLREVFALRHTLAQIMDKVHERAGMSTPQIKAADRLDRLGPATLPELAAQLDVSRQFARAVCNEMRDAGLLEFTDNPRHKRSRLAALTSAGRAALADAREKEAAIILDVLPDLDAATVTAAQDLLRRIRHRLPGFAGS